MSLKHLNTDRSWTLFLDRDGVINKRLPGDYVKNIGEFEFIEGVTEALKKFNPLFRHIVVVTNQQGIAKGIYTVNELDLIHEHMLTEVNRTGGRIDKVYFAPHLAAENHPMRKPGIGMALAAKKDFPDIDFARSVMVGDSPSDMEFGRAAGMKTVFIGPKEEQKNADSCFNSLIDFAASGNPFF